MPDVIERLFATLWSPEPLVSIQRFFGPGWADFFQVASLLGTIPGFILILTLNFWVRGRAVSYQLLAILMVATAIEGFLWLVVAHPRPDDPRLVIRAQPSVSSFPSGHVANAAIAWGIPARNRLYPPVLVIPIVLLVMLSRLYLGAHYLGDVLGGALLGAAIVASYRPIWRYVHSWLARVPFSVFLVGGMLAPVGAVPIVLLSDEGWALFGATAGACIGLPLEYSYVQYTPVRLPFAEQVRKLALGASLPLLLIGLAILLDAGVIMEIILAGLGAFWAVFLAPRLFRALGYG